MALANCIGPAAVGEGQTVVEQSVRQFTRLDSAGANVTRLH
jgi:hypothetical protein